MKPKKTSIQGEHRERVSAVCDQIIQRAAAMMVAEAGASVAMMLDRMLTYAAAQACTQNGSPKTAAAFRVMADNIDAGLFHGITAEERTDKTGH